MAIDISVSKVELVDNARGVVRKRHGGEGYRGRVRRRKQGLVIGTNVVEGGDGRGDRVIRVEP